MAQVGDEYKLYGTPGGHDGPDQVHKLMVARILVKINAIVDDITEPKVLLSDDQMIDKKPV